MSTLFRPFADWLSFPTLRPACELRARWLVADGEASGIDVRLLALGESHATVQYFADETLVDAADLELTCGDPPLHARIPGRVLLRQASLAAGRLEATVAFDRHLESELVQRLAVAGLIERRSYPRLPISLVCEARPAEGPERPLHVRVLDYSASGVRAICAEALPIGTQIFLGGHGDFSPGSPTVTLRVVRNAPHEGENLLGCVFDGRSAYFRFKSLVAADDEPICPRLARDWSWLETRAIGRTSA